MKLKFHLIVYLFVTFVSFSCTNTRAIKVENSSDEPNETYAAFIEGCLVVGASIVDEIYKDEDKKQKAFNAFVRNCNILAQQHYSKQIL
jgi:hypothetical protein